jgi:hypothetical protein
MRSLVSLALCGALVIGCGGITPGQTIPPINIPSFNLPSLPPFEIPSGIDIPSIGAPNPGGGLCRLLSAEEVSTAFGVPGMTVTETSDSSCTFSSGLTNLTMRTETGDLATAKMILGEAQDITIGQYPAVIGSFMGILLYIQKGGDQLVLQAVLIENNEENRAKVIQAGTLAASRW